MIALHFYLGEISNEMTPCVGGFRHDVEEKRLNIVIESLVIQEEFGQQTQVLTINLQKEHDETMT